VGLGGRGEVQVDVRGSGEGGLVSGKRGGGDGGAGVDVRVEWIEERVGGGGGGSQPVSAQCMSMSALSVMVDSFTRSRSSRPFSASLPS
jgi:hypothetical protein